MPAHGATNCSSVWSAPASLRIGVPSGSNTYYVKIENASGQERCHVTVGAGRTVTVGMPIGTYYLEYGAGTTWYGTTYAFGPDGTYARASESFPFSKGDAWEVELIPQLGGNLGASSVGYDDF